MDPFTILSAVIFVVKTIKKTKDGLEETNLEMNLLGERILFLEKPLQSCMDKGLYSNISIELLNNLKVLCEGASELILEYKRSGWLTRFTKFSSYSMKVAKLNSRLTTYCSDLTMVLNLEGQTLDDIQMRRQQTIDAYQKTQNLTVSNMLQEMRSDGAISRVKLEELQAGIKAQKDDLNNVLDLLHFESLKWNEMELLQQQCREINDLIGASYNEIMREMQQINRKNDELVNRFDKLLNILSKEGSEARTIRSLDLQLQPNDVEYKEIDKIGVGSFGQVYCGTYCGHMVAIKKATLIKGDKVENEAIIMRYLAHPKIVHVWGYYHEGLVSYIIAELAPYGNLCSILESYSPQQIPLTLKLSWIKDLCIAADFLRSKGVIHKDLKAQNLLVFSDAPFTIKLGDFGSARNDKSSTATSHTIGTTEAFCAPELSTGKATFQSDIFSIGMTSAQILAGTSPPPATRDRFAKNAFDALLNTKEASTSMSLYQVHDDLLNSIDPENPSIRPRCSRMANSIGKSLNELGGDPRTVPNSPYHHDVMVLKKAVDDSKRKYPNLSVKLSQFVQSDIKSNLNYPTKLLFGHLKRVNCVAVTSDGRIVSGSDDCCLRIWTTKGESYTSTILEGHIDNVTSLAVLSDGRVASGSDDGTIILWKVASFAKEATLSGHDACIYALAVSSDGRLISSSQDMSLRIWNCKLFSGKIIATLESSVSAIAFLTPRQFLCGTFDGQLQVWELDSSSNCPLLNLKQSERDDSINSIVVMKDESIICGYDDGAVVRWNNRREPTLLGSHPTSINALASTGKDSVVSGSEDGLIKEWIFNKNSEQYEEKIVGLQSDSITSIAIMSNGTKVCACNDKSIGIWEPL